MSKFMLECTFPKYEFEIETDSFCANLDDIRDTDVEEYLNDIVNEVFYFIRYTAHPQGTINELDATNDVYNCAKNFIYDNAASLVVNSKELDNHGNMIQQITIGIDELLLDMLEEENCNLEFAARVVGYVEECLFKFEAQSAWNYGLKTKHGEFITNPRLFPEPQLIDGEKIWILDGEPCCPIIWFGLTNEAPLDRWTINPEAETFDLTFWFDNEYSNFLTNIGEFSECFLIWFAECGNSVPDIDEIKCKCPIKFTETSSANEILDALNSLLLEAYNSARLQN